MSKKFSTVATALMSHHKPSNELGGIEIGQQQLTTEY